jgi:hypothetical protein
MEEQKNINEIISGLPNLPALPNNLHTLSQDQQLCKNVKLKLRLEAGTCANSAGQRVL